MALLVLPNEYLSLAGKAKSAPPLGAATTTNRDIEVAVILALGVQLNETSRFGIKRGWELVSNGNERSAKSLSALKIIPSNT